MGNIVLGIAKVLDLILDFFFWTTLISALISWVNPDPYNQIVQFLTLDLLAVRQLAQRHQDLG